MLHFDLRKIDASLPFLFILAFSVFSGCTKDMAIQNKTVFQNHVVREVPKGTVTITGQDETGASVEPTVSIEMNEATLKRGEERYQIHCAPCHGKNGAGDGLVVQRGFPRPENLASAGVRAHSDRELFAAVSDGYKTMAGYKSFITTSDRQAIVGFIRVLQLAKSFPSGNLDASDRENLEKESHQ